MATHTADCSDCDGRTVRIPAADHKEGAMRPVYPDKGNWPRFVGDRSPDYAPTEGQEKSKKIGEIPEVPLGIM